LAVLLQLGDELITLLDHVCVLLVLVVWSVCLNDALDAVNGAWDAVCSDELGEVPIKVSIEVCALCDGNLLVEEVNRNAKVVGHALQPDNSVRLEELLVASQAHLTHVPATVLVQVAILAQEVDFDLA
jgi:hypothetical protein